MTNITHQTMALSPSGFGMPACAHAFAATTGRTALDGVIGSVVRDRQAIATGLMGYAEKSFPGTTAWRPPLS